MGSTLLRVTVYPQSDAEYTNFPRGNVALSSAEDHIWLRKRSAFGLG
jgi:hypothetical protein